MTFISATLRTLLLSAAILSPLSESYAHPLPSRTDRRATSIYGVRIPIVPGVIGFGATTFAGSGRHRARPRTRIVRVKSLNDSGPDTLRECLNLLGPRTCIFDVSGEIRLETMLRIRNPYITVAGQTAPRPGITVTGGGFKIETHDVLLQHIAIRPGDSPYGPKPVDRDAIAIGARPPASAYNVVLDHLSLTWAVDENLSTWSPSTHHITITNSLIAEGLHNSIHPKGAHSKGLLIGDGSRRITVAMNAIAFNEERNPYLKPDTSTEFVNNLVYGWGARGGWSLCNVSDNEGTDHPLQLSFIGNIYRPSPESARLPPLYAKPLASHSLVYQALNVWHDAPMNASSTDGVANFSATRLYGERPRATASGRILLGPYEAYERIIQTVGSRPAERSPIDRRIIGEISAREGYIKDCTTECPRSAHAPSRYESNRAYFVLPRAPMRQRIPQRYTDLERALHRRAAEVSRVSVTAPAKNNP
jgi:hypothetical protein